MPSAGPKWAKFISVLHPKTPQPRRFYYFTAIPNMTENSIFLEVTALFWESIKDFKASSKVKFGIADYFTETLPKVSHRVIIRTG
jgi:hypothetical protein